LRGGAAHGGRLTGFAAPRKRAILSDIYNPSPPARPMNNLRPVEGQFSGLPELERPGWLCCPGRFLWGVDKMVLSVIFQ
jgi:hypothetical protein